MIDISFEINGRKVRPNQVSGELENAMLKQIEQHVRKKVGNIRDPKTGERPKITLHGRSVDDLSVKVSGPEALIEQVKRKLEA